MLKWYYYVWSILWVFFVFDHMLDQEWPLAIMSILFALYFIRGYLKLANN